jgi:hypothetical protein
MKRLLALTALVLSAQVTADAQTIADIARQERARRQAVAAKSVVLTNESLKNLPPATTSTTPAAQAAAAAAEKSAQSGSPGKDEAYWKEAFKTAREDIKRGEDRIALLQLDLNRANRDYLQRSDVYNREFRIGAEIADIKARLDVAQKELDASKRKLAALEEEFRRSGAPAGWAR